LCEIKIGSVIKINCVLAGIMMRECNEPRQPEGRKRRPRRGIRQRRINHGV